MGIRRCMVAAVAAAVAVGLITVVPADAATAFTVSGTRILHPPPYPEQLLPASFAGDTVTHIDYPASVFGMDASISIAAAGIIDDVANTPGEVIVAGFSQGAIALTYAKQQLMALPVDQRPDPGRLSFITIGDPAGAGGILRFLPVRIPFLELTPVVAPETPYDTVVVTGEYDGWADFPDRPWNLVSVANAILGIVYVHGRYETVPGGLDLSAVPAADITVVKNSLGGKITTYVIPTVKLPLLQPLRDIGIPESVVTAFETPLKTIVDSGYVRAGTAALPVATLQPGTAATARVESTATPRRASGVAATVGSARAGTRRAPAAPTASVPKRPARQGDYAAVA